MLQPDFRRLTTPADPAFATLLAIYTEAHPASERKPEALLRAMIERREYRVEVVLQGETIAGFGIVLDLPGADASLLEYMAIAPEYRGHGLGTLLYRHLLPTPARFLLAEVESDHVASADRELRERRKHFYRNLGCLEIDGLDYVMPPVATTTPPPMNLMIHRASLPGSIARDRLRGWLEAIYREVYAVPVPDGRIDGMVAPLPEDIALV